MADEGRLAREQHVDRRGRSIDVSPLVDLLASKLLRHSDIRVTERVYVPLGIEVMREALAETHKERCKVIELDRNEDEMGLLHESAKAVKEVADVLDGMGV